MKTKLAKLVTGIMLGLGVTASAMATPIDTLFASRNASNFIVSDLSGEIALNADGTRKNPLNDPGDSSSADNLKVGDFLVGALGFESFSNPVNPINATGRELTAIFATKVASTAVVTGNTNDYIMGTAGAAFWTTQLGATQAGILTGLGIDLDKVAGLVFEDAAGGFDRGNGVASGFSEAGDGALRMVIGFDGADDYWVARGPRDISTFSSGGSTTNPLGQFNFGLSILYENLSVTFGSQAAGLTQDEIDTSYTGTALIAANAGVVADIVGDGSLFRPTNPNPGVTDPFPIYNKVDVSFTTVPEPATLGLLGLGLLGMGGFSARRRKATV